MTTGIWKRATTLGAGLWFGQLALAASIVVGQVAPLSGLDANQGRSYSTGMQLYFNQVNKAGGAGGHTFTLARKDSGGRGEEVVAATQQLLSEQRPLLLAGYFGSRAMSELASSKLLEKEKIPLVGFRSAEVQQDVPYIYHVRAGLKDEIGKIVTHLSTVGINRLGLFYEEGPGAAALIAAADEAAQKAGAKVLVKASYAAGTARVESAVKAVTAAGPQAVILVASGAASAALIENYRSSGGAAQFFACSEVDAEQLAKRLADEHMQGVSIAQVVPSPYKISNRLSKEFNDAVAKTQDLEVPVSYAMMEGYIAAKVIVEAARRMGPKPSREGLAAALDNLGSYDLGGYFVSFQPGQRAGSKYVDLSIISGGGRVRQ